MTMELAFARDERAVRVVTVFGAVEGSLRCGSTIRTLDEINMPSVEYLVVHHASGSTAGAEGPLAIRKDAILFVHEARKAPGAGARPSAAAFWKAGVELRVHEFTIRGTVHIPPGGDPFARLNQRNPPFMALTAATIAGPDGTSEVAFLAVNRQHVLAARELDVPAEEEDVDDLEAISS